MTTTPQTPATELDQQADDSEERFLVECLKDCFCCDQCGNQRPCAGVTAGGLCDRMCFCRDEEDERNDDE